MTVLDAVEEYIVGTSSGHAEPEARAHHKSFQALNVVGTSVMQSLSEWPAVMRAEGTRWVNLSSPK